MSPKAIDYKANSIIYFKGDQGEKIYILKTGKVSLNYTDIETGQEIHDLIKTGEFFGVKSALGRYPREETGIVLTDSSVVAFSVPEFEQLALKNSRIIMKMLKVFSNQLRRIHKQVQNLLYVDEQIKPEDGLFSIGEYYLKNKKYEQAIYAFKRYLVYYPSGVHADKTTKKIDIAEGLFQKYGTVKETQVPAVDAKQIDKPDKTKQITDAEKSYYRAINLISQDKYEEAYKLFKFISEQEEGGEYTAKSQYEMGRCLFLQKKYDECLKLLTRWVQKYPKHPEMKDALFLVGSCYENKNEKDRAKGLYKKILTITPQSESLYRKANKALKRLEGKGK